MVEVQQRLNSLSRYLKLPSDEPLFIHSAFSMSSRDGYTPDAVLDHFCEFTKNSTLLLPTMSWRYVKPHLPVFDEIKTPSNTGVLTEVFRVNYSEQRSLHPTHSVAGLGHHLETFLGAHHIGDTPCSKTSPFGQLVENNATILMFGITMDCCTIIHHVEEIVAPDLYLHSTENTEEYTCIDRYDFHHPVKLRRHLFLPRDYLQYQDELAQRDQLKIAVLGRTICRVFKARDLFNIVMESLARDASAIIAKSGQRYRMM